MEDKGCSSELLKKLYFDENKTQKEIKNIFNIGEKLLNRWFKEAGIEKRIGNGKYYFNKKYFDEINTEDKAYWIGFIWGDGYAMKRRRQVSPVYEFKLDLVDKDQVIKFKQALDSNHPIKTYYQKRWGKNAVVYRLYIANNYFVKNLFDNYGLIPNRFDASKLLSRIPPRLYNHFIRGILDAEGSISDYYIKDPRWGSLNRKMTVRFYTYEELLTFIQDTFYKNKLIKNISQTRKRHKDRDGYCQELSYSGTQQVPKILNYLYQDAHIYLDRKYEKYLKIINQGAK